MFTSNCAHRFDPRYIRVLKRRRIAQAIARGIVESAEGLAAAVAAFGLGVIVAVLALMVTAI